jgi:hypothetical protein
MPIDIMATECLSRIVVAVVKSVLYTAPDDGIQITRVKTVYRTLLHACLKNIWKFRSKMTIKHNKVRSGLRVVEKAIA